MLDWAYLLSMGFESWELMHDTVWKEWYNLKIYKNIVRSNSDITRKVMQIDRQK